MRAVATRFVLAGTVAATVVAGAVVTTARPSRADGTSTIERARQAAELTNYDGQVTIKWDDLSGTMHATTVHVQGGGGVVRVGGQDQLAATSTARWLYRDGGWDLMSPARLATLSVPLPDKYRFVDQPGVTVAGRPTDLVQLWTGGRLVERFFQDQATGLVLRRDLFNQAGDIVRSVAFDSVAIGSTTAPPPPSQSVDVRPHAAKAPPAPYVAPGTVAGGYTRVTTLREPGALQVLYSDGVHGLSLFEQAGRLDLASAPPGGRAVTVGSATGLTYAYAGGQVVVWQSGGTTFTLVGDGTPEDVLVAARSLPHARPLSVLDRIRRAALDILRAA